MDRPDFVQFVLPPVYIFDKEKFRLVLFTDKNGKYIILDQQPSGILFTECFPRGEQMISFFPVHPVFRISKQVVMPRLDFNNMQDTFAAGENIDFIATMPPVAADQFEALPEEPFGSQLLTLFPEFLMCGQFCFILSLTEFLWNH